jgi:hypothetical protein
MRLVEILPTAAERPRDERAETPVATTSGDFDAVRALASSIFVQERW